MFKTHFFIFLESWNLNFTIKRLKTFKIMISKYMKLVKEIRNTIQFMHKNWYTLWLKILTRLTYLKTVITLMSREIFHAWKFVFKVMK